MKTDKNMDKTPKTNPIPTKPHSFTDSELKERDQDIAAAWKKALQEALFERDTKWKAELENINTKNELRLLDLEHQNKVLNNIIIELKSNNSHTNNNMDFEDLPDSSDEDFSNDVPTNKKRTIKNQNVNQKIKNVKIQNSEEETWPNLPVTNNSALTNQFIKVGLKKNNNSNTEKSQTSSPKNNSNQQNLNAAPKPPRVPPVVIRNKSMYSQISTHFKNSKINFSRATNVEEGVKLFPETPNDYNNMIKFLETQKIPFHSYRLPEEREIHVVLRGVLEDWTEEKIKKDLENLNFTPSKVIRWKRKDGSPMPLVLVFLPINEKHIFDLNFLDLMTIKVEAQKSTTNFSQCHRCQVFGHSQFRCTAPIKCLICAQEHFSFECDKQKVLKPKCANCEGEHPSSSKECPKHPVNSKRFINKNNNNKNANNTTPFVWGQQNNNNLIPNNNQTTPVALETSINNSMNIFFKEFSSMMMLQMQNMFKNFETKYSLNGN